MTNARLKASVPLYAVDDVSMSSEAELFTLEEERWYAWQMLPGYQCERMGRKTLVLS